MMDILKKTCISAAATLALAALAIMAGSQEAHAVCVKVGTANLRTGPGTNYMKVWLINRYMPLEKLEEINGWYRVLGPDGGEFWIFNRLVTDKYKCAVVTADETPLYMAPEKGAKQNEVSPVFKYSTFRIIKTDGDWHKVRGNFKDIGWLPDSTLWVR